MIATILAAAAAAVFLSLYLREKQAKGSVKGAPSASQVTSYVANKEQLGVLAKLFAAVAQNDRDAVRDEISYINRRVADEGGFEGLTENYVYSQLDRWLADPQKKQKLLARLGLVPLVAPAAAAPAAI